MAPSNATRGPTAAGGKAPQDAFPGGNCSSRINPKAHKKQPKSRGGRASRDKGNREERLLVNFFQQHGFGAERILLSGACGGRYGSDIFLPLLGIDRKLEVKVRQHGFEMLYRWLAGNDALIIRKNREHALVVMPLHSAVEIAVAAERGRTTPPILPAETEYSRRIRRLLAAANIKSPADRGFVSGILLQPSLDGLSSEQWAIINKILRQAARLYGLQESVL